MLPFARRIRKERDLVRWKLSALYMHDYLACIASVDESVASAFWITMRTAGLEDSTIVVYASDQGFYLGEHGWFDKRWIFGGIAAHALLDSGGPTSRKHGSVNKDIVSNVDFAVETFLGCGRSRRSGRDAGQELGTIASRTLGSGMAKEFFTYHYYESISGSP